MKRVLFLASLMFVLVVGCSKNEQTPATGENAANPAANAEKVTFLLNVVVEPEGAGVVTPANGAFDKGTTIELNATANNGFTFERWEGDVVGTTNMVQVVLDGNKNLKAIFKAADAGAAAPAGAVAPAAPATDTNAAAPAAPATGSGK